MAAAAAGFVAAGEDDSAAEVLLYIESAPGLQKNLSKKRSRDPKRAAIRANGAVKAGCPNPMPATNPNPEAAVAKKPTSAPEFAAQTQEAPDPGYYDPGRR